MTFQKTGGLAGLACAATYLFGFAFLVTVLTPLGFGSSDIDTQAVIGFIETSPGLMILFNTVIYIINALALAVLVVALHAHLSAATPQWAVVTGALGVIWATLVLGAGMIANVGVEQTALLAATDPDRATAFWEVMHAVELGLGGGNEIAGGVWILLVSLAGLSGKSLGKAAIGLGLLTGAGGLLTLVPSLGDTAGAVFGLGAIAWFIAVGLELLVRRTPATARVAGQVAA